MDEKKNKKKFMIPESEIISFGRGDIITISGEDSNDTDWTNDPDGEDFNG